MPCEYCIADLCRMFLEHYDFMGCALTRFRYKDGSSFCLKCICNFEEQ